MFVVIKKRHISVIIILLVLTMLVVLMFASSNVSDESAVDISSVSSSGELKTPDEGRAILVNSINEGNYILEAKNDRDIARSKICDILKNTMENNNVSEEAKLRAEQELIDIAGIMDIENKCETLLESKGFGECVVIVSHDNITVTLDKEGITENDVAKINDIIFEQTRNNNIKIVEVN